MSDEQIVDVPPGYVPFCVTDYLDNDEMTWLYFVDLAEPENERIFWRRYYGSAHPPRRKVRGAFFRRTTTSESFRLRKQW